MDSVETDTRAGGIPPSTKIEFADSLPARMQTQTVKPAMACFRQKTGRTLALILGKMGFEIPEGGISSNHSSRQFGQERIKQYKSNNNRKLHGHSHQSWFRKICAIGGVWRTRSGNGEVSTRRITWCLVHISLTRGSLARNCRHFRPG